MTATEAPPTTAVIGQRLLRREDPALLTGEARFTNDLARARRAAPRARAQPVRPRPDHPHRHGCGGCAPRRRRRLHGRRPRRRLGGAHAVRLAGHRGHEEPAPLSRWPRTRCATWATASWPSSPPARSPPSTPPRLVEVDYEPLEAVIDLEDALSDRVRHPRRARHQQELHLGAQGRGATDGAVDKAFEDAAFQVTSATCSSACCRWRWRGAPSSPFRSRSAATSRSTRPRRSPTSSRS